MTTILLGPNDKDAESPATTSFAWDTMMHRWLRIDPLLGGTEAMKSAGTNITPQHEEEGIKAYEERVNSCVLFNMTELTLNSWVGRPFSDPVTLSDDTPEEITALTDDIDLQGNCIDVFARNWFKTGLAKAMGHVLIDFPVVGDINPDGQPRTLADDLRENVRPYWVNIRPENLFFAKADLVDGVEVLTHARILETVIELDGFMEVAIPQIRVFDAGVLMEDESIHTVVRIFRIKKSKKKKLEWIVHSTRVLTINFIPIVTFYADRESFMVGKPPIQDLADLNIRHWQSNSDQISVLTVARFPILAGSGVGSADRVAIGPHQWLTTTDPHGRWYYVEHSGKAIAAGREELKDLEMAMSEYGAEFLKKRPDRETATARALDSAEASSPLMDAILRFKDSMDTALSMTAVWLGLDKDSAGEVTIAMDFGAEEFQEFHLELLRFARENGDISRDTFLREMQRLGALPDDFDFNQNDTALQKEEDTQLKRDKELAASKPAPAPAAAAAKPKPTPKPGA